MRLISKKNVVIVLSAGCGVYGCVSDLSDYYDGN